MVVDEVYEILSRGEWIKASDIAEELKRMDPVWNRNMSTHQVLWAIRRLRNYHDIEDRVYRKHARVTISEYRICKKID